MTANQRRWLRPLTVLVVFVLVVVILSHSLQKNAKSAQPPVSPAILVVTAVAKMGNQPIYLVDLGTVTPFETVTGRGRVDGELMNVGVEEGQMTTAVLLIKALGGGWSVRDLPPVE
jgi:multidrug efflux pump subunit AcrA (membrane-fusion protein)